MRGESDPYHLANVYLALGDRDKAIDALDRSVELGSGMVTGMNADVRLASLRSDPRFVALVERTRVRSDRE